jgi:oligopeptide/dipeptide ABC transporter ATP-binding protein
LERLGVEFPGEPEPLCPVVGVDLEVREGEMVGLVGESGSGKTLTALAALDLVPSPGRWSGDVVLDGQRLRGASTRELRAWRGRGIGMIFQEATAALDPVLTIGAQLGETVRVHRQLDRGAARLECERLLERVAIPDPGACLRAYPHQLSGGQRQRAMIALALASEPRLLLADEPTTALDVTLQAEILQLLERLRVELGLAVVLITHDLAVVAESCDRLYVMYAGAIVEEGTVDRVLRAPAHPYTRALIDCLPRLGAPGRHGAGLPFIPGRAPAPHERPAGCAFHPRCAWAEAKCRRESPPVTEVDGRRVSCWRADDPALGGASE